MRDLKGRAYAKGALLLFTSLVLVTAAVFPAIAAAATPKSTLLTSTIYMPTAKAFTISGRISSSLRGKRMAVEIRKPGRTFWTLVGQPGHLEDRHVVAQVHAEAGREDSTSVRGT